MAKAAEGQPFAIDVKPSTAKYAAKKASSSSKKIKIPVISSDSFVGITPRSIFGCMHCKKRKKKCDEEYPQCGSCARKGLECQWKNIPLASSMKDKDKFSLSFLHLRQNDINKKKKKEANAPVSIATDTDAQNDTGINSTAISTTGDATSSVIGNTGGGQQSISAPLNDDNDLIIIPSNLEYQIPYRNITPKVTKTTPTTTATNTTTTTIMNQDNDLLQDEAIEEIDHHPMTHHAYLKMGSNDEHNLLSLSPLLRSNPFSPSLTNNSALDDSIENIAYGLINYLKSPNFEPFHKESDLLITKAINHGASHLYHDKKDEYFEEIDLNDKEEDNKDAAGGLGIPSGNDNDDNYDDDDEAEYEEGVHALDESQMVENNYFDEDELLNVSLNALKSRTGLKYFKPAFQLLFNPCQLTAKSPVNFQLDDTSRLFLDHYVNYVVKTITCVSPNNSRNDDFNYFSNFLLRMAMSDESQILLNGLIAWGGMFLLGNKNPYSQRLSQNCLNVVRTKLLSTPINPYTRQFELTNEDYLKILSFYIISIGSHISTGDTVNWFPLFKEFKILIDSYGGSKKFLNDNTDATGARWMIAYLYSHDISNSSAMINGTLMKLNEYKELMNDNNYHDLMYYEIDPLMGCSQSLYIIFGEIVNKSSELRRLRYTDQYKDDVQFKKLVDDTFYSLQAKIIACELNSTMMTDLFHDTKQLESHVILFELIQLQLLIIIRISIRETSFDDIQLQKLCNDLNKRIDFLIGSQVQSAMAFSFLVGGILNIDQESREKTRKRYEIFKNNYPVVNLVRAWDIVVEVWKRLDRLMVDMTDESFLLLRNEIGESDEFTDIVLLVEETMMRQGSGSNSSGDFDFDNATNTLNMINSDNGGNRSATRSQNKKRKKLFVDWVEVASDFGWDVCLI